MVNIRDFLGARAGKFESMILITGGSGEVAQQVALKLLEAKQSIRIYGRGDVNESPLLNYFEKVDNYNNLDVDQRADALLVTNGSFIFKKFKTEKSN